MSSQQQGSQSAPPKPPQQPPQSHPHVVAASTATTAAVGGGPSTMNVAGGGGSGGGGVVNGSWHAAAQQRPQQQQQHVQQQQRPHGYPQQAQQGHHRGPPHPHMSAPGVGGGRGGGPNSSYGGGRGGGRGGPPPYAMQQQPPPQGYPHPSQQRGSASGPTGAWQPAQPTSASLQHAQPGMVPPQQQGQPPHSRGGAGGGPYGQPPPPYHTHPAYNPYPAAYHHPQQQQQQQPPPQQQQQQQHSAWQPAYTGTMRGGVFYPPPQQQQQQQHQPPHAGGGLQPHPPHAPQGNRGAAANVNTKVGRPSTSAAPVLGATTSLYAPPKQTKKPLVITDKHGNVLDFSSIKGGGSASSSSSASKAKVVTPTEPSKPTTTASSTTAAATTTAPATAAPSTLTANEAGENLRQAVLERLQADTKKKTSTNGATEEEPAKATEPKEKKEEEGEIKQKEEEEKAPEKQEPAEAKQAEKEPAPKAPAQKEEEKAQTEAPAAETKPAEKEPNGAKPKPATGRIVFTKEALLKFCTDALCQERPQELPDMTIVKGMSRGRSTGNTGGGGGGGGGGRRGAGGGDQGGGDGEWKRGNAPPRRQSSKTMSGGGGGGPGGGGGGGDWVRGQAMPPQKQGNNANNNNPRNTRGGRGGRGGGPNQQPQFDGPIVPLVKTENHWRPKKNSTPLVVAEKLVKSILNKMTKEKFERLSQQMIEIEILSYDMLTMMIENVYDKAIDEPAFGDIYADLCVKISQSVSTKGATFVHIIESDEEPPTESGEPGGSAPGSGGGSNEASHNTVYRWSNDVSTTDSEVIGPFDSEEACRDAAQRANDGDQTDTTPIPRDEMALELVSVVIRKNMFIKVMKKKNPVEEDGGKIYYTVFFPVSEATECGQQLSDIHLSEVEAVSDANKKNSFKRSLLNKCEEEFNKQDIYKEWKEEKAAYEQSKSSLSEAEQSEKAGELEFRRIRIKKQMLGNVKFIGQLFKKNMLKEKIMRYCIGSLLKLEEIDVKSKNPEYEDKGNMDMDEEDHEAICNMFTTIGSTIDKPSATTFMDVCFGKIRNLSQDTALPARSRFMYKDLIDLRKNSWVPRRKEEKAKTIDEIRKDFEQEERKQAEQSQRENARSNMNQSFRGGGGSRNDYRQQGGPRGGGTRDARSRASKATPETDDEGFTTIASGKGGGSGGFGSSGRGSRGESGTASRSSMAPPPVTTKQSAFALLADNDSSKPFSASDDNNKSGATSGKKAKVLDEDQLKRRIKSIRNEFMGDGGNVAELTLSIQELEATPNGPMEFIQQSLDGLIDAKESERVAIVKILTILVEQKLVPFADAKAALLDCIEFIDSFVMDCPKIYDYWADLLASWMRINALTVQVLCELLEKPRSDDPQSKAPLSIVRLLIPLLGPQKKELLGTAQATTCLTQLLGKAEWNALASSL